MRNHYILTAMFAMSSFGATQAQIVDKITSPVDYVNPLMGTQSSFELSTGNTYPAIGRRGE